MKAAFFISMANPSATVDEVKDKAEEAAYEVNQSQWVDSLARLGYIVRGVLYAVVGLLAVQVALGARGETTDQVGAIAAIAAQPFGTLLLVMTVIGLAGYSLWGFVRAIFDPLGKGTDPKGIAERVGYAVSGIVYGSLIGPTVQFIEGAREQEESERAGNVTAWVMSQPFGVWIVGIVGVIAMVGGLGQFYIAYKAGFKKQFRAGSMSQEEMKLAVLIGRIGHAARGVVFVLGGFFVLQAALHTNPDEARGLDGALATLAQQPYGPWLLGVVALGLVVFGVFSILSARWMEITRS